MTALHVIPMWSDSLRKYVGSYRCDADWKAAIEETRARLHAPTTDRDLEGAMVLEVILARGVTEERLRTFVSGKPMTQALDAALDALATGQLKLTL